MSPRCLADQTPAQATAAAGADHLGRRPGLVDEDQARGIKQRLSGFPALPRFSNVGLIPLGGVQSFFEADAMPAEKAID
jgi:hypothetical protein